MLRLVDDSHAPDAISASEARARAYERRYARLLEVALRGVSWETVAEGLALSGHRRPNGEEWTAKTAKMTWSGRSRLRHGRFRRDAQIVPIIELGVSGRSWDDVCAMLLRAGRLRSLTGHNWTPQRVERVFNDFARLGDHQTRRHNIAALEAGDAPIDAPSTNTRTHRIVTMPGLHRSDQNIENDLTGVDPFVEPMLCVCVQGTGWGMAADVLAELAINPPEPFDIWCGLLVERFWDDLSSHTARDTRSKNRHTGGVDWDAALAAGQVGRDRHRSGVADRSLRRLW